MKVLKEGKWNVPWSGKYGCPTCDAELLVEEADVKPVMDCWKYVADCMLCGKALDIPMNDLPLRVKESVDKKRKWYSSD